MVKHEDSIKGIPLIKPTTLLPSLPAAYYLDPNILEREYAAIWRTQWQYLMRLDTLKEPGAFKVFRIGDREIFIVLNEDREYRGFYNVCRHRGSVLCEADSGQFSGNIICPYHQWSYGLDGALIKMPRIDVVNAIEDLNLLPVALTTWGGNLYVNLDSKTSLSLESMMIPGPNVLDNWPLERLAVGHRTSFTLACNWKVFWENYLECYHCPAIHPELSQIVPLYQAGLSTANLDPDHPAEDRVAAHIESWTTTGRAIAPAFSTLTAAEQVVGHTFVEIYPNQYLVAHADYVRQVSLQPRSVTSTQVTAEWLFDPDFLSDPDADLSPAIDFGARVLDQDTRVCELNQRGLAASGRFQGHLTHLEQDLADFHDIYRNWMQINT